MKSLSRAVPEPVRNILRSGRDAGAFYTKLGFNRELKRRYLRAAKPEDYLAIGIDGFSVVQKTSEILGFIDLLNQEAPVTICEIGMFGGGTTFLLSQAVRSVRTTIGVDIRIRNEALLRYLRRPGQRLHLVRGSSYSPATVARVKAALRGISLDVLFIDGDHRYAGVASDFLAYRPMVREDGIIGFHDIISDYNARYGRQTVNWAGDVPRFWKAISGVLPAQEFVDDRDQDAYGIGVLRNRKGVQITPADVGLSATAI